MGAANKRFLILQDHLPQNGHDNGRRYNGLPHTQLHTLIRDEAPLIRRLQKYAPSPITVFGSARIAEADPLFEQARDLGYQLGQAGHSVITGGASGIMHAVNAGTRKAQAVSVGVRVVGFENLEGQYNPQQEHYSILIECHSLTVRKQIMTLSDAFVLFPGGIGTLDELFEVLVPIQTRIATPVPIIAIDRTYWEGLLGWMQDQALTRKLIDAPDLKLVQLVDSNAEVMEILRSANVSRTYSQGPAAATASK